MPKLCESILKKRIAVDCKTPVALIAIEKREYFVIMCSAILFNDQLHWPLNDLVLKVHNDFPLPVCMAKSLRDILLDYFLCIDVK